MIAGDDGPDTFRDLPDGPGPIEARGGVTLDLVRHGGLMRHELERLGLADDDVLDASVNVNPYGPCAAVVSAIRDARIDRYPDPDGTTARRALARWLGVSEARIVLGNGAVDLLWLLARARLGPGKTIVIVEPAFSEMRAAALHTGARVLTHRLSPELDFAFDAGAFDAQLARERPEVAYLATPANPTGVRVAREDLAALAARHPATQLVIDVSFASLGTRPEDASPRGSERLAWVRSLTKDLALPGLRVGLGVLPPSLAMAVVAERPPWSVNAMAEAAAIAATGPEAEAFVADSRTRLLADRAHLDAGLLALGLRVHPSETIFTLADLGAGRDATALRASLLARHAVLVRDATSFGLPRHVRIAARPASDLARLLRALAHELAGHTEAASTR